MSDGRSDQGPPPHEPAPGPDWVMQTPKPIELPPIDEAESQTKKPARERGGRPTAWLALILALVVALVGTSPYWAPGLAALLPWGPRNANEAFDQLDQRQGEIARRQVTIDQHLTKIEDQLRGLNATAGAVKDLDQRVAALEQQPRGEDPQRLSALQQEMQKLAAAHEATGERVAKMEQRRDAATGERGEEALLLALGQLRSRVQGSQPFAAELGAVVALGRNHPEVRDNLAPLTASAATGIPSVSTLSQRFDHDVAPALMRSAAPASDGWGAQIMNRLRSLVVVRRVGSSAAGADDSVEGGVAHAETALASGDLAGAVKSVEALPTANAQPAQSWLADARRRLAAEQGLARLTDQLTAQLATEDRAAAEPAPQGSGH
jgi:hypothetical protein